MLTIDTREGVAAEPIRANAPTADRSVPARAATSVLVGLVVAYQRVISPWLPNTCRFEPSCSQYAREALTEHGPLRGAWLTVRRLSRCHPLGGHGYDPVPDRDRVKLRSRMET